MNKDDKRDKFTRLANNRVNIVLDNKIITKDYIKEKIKLYRENGVVEDIAEECPIVMKFIDKILVL